MWKELLHTAQAIQQAWSNSQTAHQISEARGDMAKMADDATSAFGRQLRSFGRTLGGTQVPGGPDTMAALPSAVAASASQGLERAGEYLEEKGLGGVVNDLGEKVKQHPLPFLAAGIGLGIILGRLLPSRRS